MTPGFATSTRLDLNQIGEARNSMLGIKLDQVITYCGSAAVCVVILQAPWVIAMLFESLD